MTRAAAAVEARFSILIVEDEAPMRKVLRLILEEQGYEVFECGSGAEALSFISRSPPSLVLLDLGLPDVDGIDLAKQIRGYCPVPIVVLSMRADEHSIVEALDNGADDYVTKPFRENELFARVRACLRNVPPGGAREIDGVRVDPVRRVAFVANREIKLSATEHRLLWVLLRAKGNVMTHQQLLREVWGAAYVRDAGYLRVYMHHLREKLEADPSNPRWLLTEPGVGYRLGGD
jgi:two-component system KDP operon response regulator KdpE